MSVVEELVAKIGVKAEGIPELKKLDGALKNAKSGLDLFGKSMNKNLGSGAALSWLDKLKSGLPAFAAHLKSSTSLVSTLASAFGSVAGFIVKATTKLGAFMTTMVLARLAAAKFRREAQWDAEGKRTTAGGVDKLKTRLGAIGLTDDETSTLHSGIAEKMNAAIKDGDYKDFQSIGVKPLDKDHNQRNSADVTEEIVAKYVARQQKAFELRKKIEAAQKAGKQTLAKKLIGQADAIEKSNRDIAGKFGLDPITGKLRLTSPTEMDRKAEEAERNHPPMSAEKEKQLIATAKELEKFSDSIGVAMKGLLYPFRELADAINSIALPKLNAFADGVVSKLKSMGMIDKTPNEVREEEERDRETRRGVARMNQPSKSVEGLARIAEELEARGAGKGAFASLFGDEKDRFVQAFRAWRAAEDNKQLATMTQGIDSSVMSNLITQAQEAFATLVGAAQKLKDVQNTNDATVKGEGKKANDKAQTKEDRRTYTDIGNDKRTITNSVTVNATGLEAVGAKVKAEILGAISTKAANTSTGALNQP